MLTAAILLTLILAAGTYVALETVFGRLAAAVLCPVGWALVTAAEGLIDLVRGDD